VRLLLDTHALLWWYSDDAALPASCRKLIAESDSSVFVSAVSAWEISTKFRLGKLPTAGDLIDDFSGYTARERFLSPCRLNMGSVRVCSQDRCRILLIGC
jgi:PIN domain nuclease of toxin-antitoxin system